MDEREFRAMLAEVRASEHDEPRTVIPRLETMLGEDFVAHLPNGVSYDEIRGLADWQDLMDLLWLDDSQVAGMNMTVADWDRNGTVHLMVEDAMQHEFFTTGIGPRVTGGKLRYSNGHLDVLTWQGYSPRVEMGCWLTVSSFAVDDVDRRLTLVGTVRVAPESRALDNITAPENHLRKARQWARERYHLAKFDGLVIPS